MDGPAMAILSNVGQLVGEEVQQLRAVGGEIAELGDELDKIIETLNPKELSGHMDAASDKNLGNINNPSEEDLITYCCDVSGNFEDAWRSGLRLHDDEKLMHSSNSRQYASNRQQVYVIINDTSEEFDAENNPVINPQNIERGANHRAEE
jgi:hypothetical protein